jgi:hypothetical protein
MPAASEVAIGCLQKPYTERQLKAALESVDRYLAGKKVKPIEGLELFVAAEQ